MPRLWRTIILVLLMVLGLAGSLPLPKVNAIQGVADVYITDFTLHKGELLWFWKSQVYFTVVSYGFAGWALGVGSEWDTRNYPSPGGWKTDVAKDTLYTVNYLNQVRYDLGSFVQGYSVAFVFSAYKNGWWGDEILLAEKISFSGPGHYTHHFGNNDIEFNVRFDWQPCPDGQSWDGANCVCPPGQEWNGQQCVTPPPSTTVSVYSLPESWQGPPANGASSDLGESISVSYTLGGISQPSKTQNTPFNFQADVGSQMTLFVVGHPSGWSFVCNWDQYGIRQHPNECTLTTTVMGNDQIAAFFGPPTCPDGQVWTESQCACPSGQDWNGQQCVTPKPSCPDGSSWDGSECACPQGQEWSGNGQYCVSRETELTQVSGWALDVGYLGQDPAGLEGHDLHASIYMNHIWHGQLYQDVHVTPFVIDADVGSTITFTVESPNGFTCTWDHYGWQQHPNTCTLEIQVGHNDKIVAFFRFLADQGDPNLVYATSAGGHCGAQCTTETQDQPFNRPIIVSAAHVLPPDVSRDARRYASQD